MPTRRTRPRPNPGIPALLDALKAEGIQCAVFSNKADALCGGIIAHYFGTGRFDAVRGNRPGVPTKPDPTGLYALMTELGADPAATPFCGRQRRGTSSPDTTHSCPPWARCGASAAALN